MARSIHSFSRRKWPDGRPIRRRHQLHGVGRQPGVAQAVGQNAMQGDVGVQRLAAAAEDDGVAALDAQAGRVHRHVGPRFVDEEDHAERAADFVDLQAVGPDGAGPDLSHRVRQRRHLAQAVGGVAQPGRRQPQPIDLRRGQAGLAPRRPRPFRWRPGSRRLRSSRASAAARSQASLRAPGTTASAARGGAGAAGDVGAVGGEVGRGGEVHGCVSVTAANC